MGCYGIGIARVMACILEQHHDDQGMVWPKSVAPYGDHIIPVGAEPSVIAAAGAVYRAIGAENALYDDRDLHPGSKFTDADLLGMPTRITVSRRSLAAGGVEVKDRKTGAVQIVSVTDLHGLMKLIE